MNSRLLLLTCLAVSTAVWVVAAETQPAIAQDSGGPPAATPQGSVASPDPAPEALPLPLPLADQPGDSGAGQAAELGYEPLLKGPVHEAFAVPNMGDSSAPRTVAKPPPAPIDEQPPTPANEQQGLQWIAGYWAWNEETDDYVWVSGMWRQIPPGRTWIPGYWTETTGGYRWTRGYWAGDASGTQYLPEPPESIDNGPSVPPPREDCFWVPGHWQYLGTDYRWQSGFWSFQPEGWVWQPSCYVHTPQGYLLADGFWDYPPTARGQLFAPVHFHDPVYLNPRFVYRPCFPLVNASALLLQLFARPGFSHYFYGNFYDSRSWAYGYRPWYDIGFGSGYGAPWLAFFNWRYGKQGIHFGRSMRQHGRRIQAWPHPHGAKSIGGQVPGQASGALLARGKPSKGKHTLDTAVRANAVRVSMPPGQAKKGLDQRVHAPPSRSAGPHGVKGHGRFSAAGNRGAGSSTNGFSKSKSVSPGHGRSKPAGPSKSHSAVGSRSVGSQGFSRGPSGGSRGFSGGSKSAGKSKGGSRGRGKGKK